MGNVGLPEPVNGVGTLSRIAHCSCGSLRAETTGEPVLIIACHCLECQRRTGALFGAAAWFNRAQVRTEGDDKVFIRDADKDRKVRFHFCPTCGTTVYYEADLRPDLFAVTLGAFADPCFPAPTRSVWEESRHSWVEFGHELRRFPQAAPVPHPDPAD